ncbi:hypothetical protein VNO77_30410 [Canavalia gladiata]|uniref:Uncharacterized protein n=1 Tax=Canavalia gladiata TaxID=3824 RepID=A0AAN9KR25_CANGL
MLREKFQREKLDPLGCVVSYSWSPYLCIMTKEKMGRWVLLLSFCGEVMERMKAGKNEGERNGAKPPFGVFLKMNLKKIRVCIW